MRRAQEQTKKSRDYAQVSLTTISSLTASLDRTKHPLLDQRLVKRGLMIVIGSDRGLAGAYNSLLARTASLFLTNNDRVAFEVVTIGQKAQDYFRQTKIKLRATFTNLPIHPTIRDVGPIAKLAIDGFSQKIYDAVYMSYTHCHSTIKQEPMVSQILPVVLSDQLATTGSSGDQESVEPAKQTLEYRFEPTQDELLKFILPRVIEVQIYQKILEAIASEQSARMVAMKNASDNAREIIDQLNLSYNSLRQAKITQELTEISTAVRAV